METIGQILRRSREEASLAAASRNCSLASLKERESFLVEYNPEKQLAMCRNSRDCYVGDYPTLSIIGRDYGERTTTAWLLIQLYDLSEFCGSKDKLEGSQLEQCAHIIAAEFSFLKVSEVMLFFYQFKAGRYGHFYGAVDPLRIMVALRVFVRERGEELFRIEEEKRKIERDSMFSNSKSITYEEYISLCRKE